MQRGRQARGLQFEAIVQRELQWQAQEVLCNIAADLLYQLQCMVVAAEQDVLAVVELGAIMQHTSCASAELSGALEYRDRHSDRSCAAQPCWVRPNSSAMIGVRFLTDMHPFRAGDPAMLPDDLARKMVAEKSAVLHAFPANPHGVAAGDPLPVAEAKAVVATQPPSFREKIQHAIPVGYRKKG